MIGDPKSELRHLKHQIRDMDFDPKYLKWKQSSLKSVSNGSRLFYSLGVLLLLAGMLSPKIYDGTERGLILAAGLALLFHGFGESDRVNKAGRELDMIADDLRRFDSFSSKLRTLAEGK